MAGVRRGRVVSLGVHIVDVLGRPVSHIPPGQGRQLLDEIRITAAGTAAGTSVDLAKLGADVIAMGAIGDDLLADFLTSVLDGHGIDTHLLARKRGVQTSATILPIRANGERPALHTPGATSRLTEADIDLTAIATADVLHVGGPDVLGRFAGEPLERVLEFARDKQVTTTMDVLASRDASAWDRLRPLLRHVQLHAQRRAARRADRRPGPDRGGPLSTRAGDRGGTGQPRRSGQRAGDGGQAG